MNEILTFSDIFTPASKEEIVERKKKYVRMIFEDVLNNIKEKTKLLDGSYHIHSDLSLLDKGLTSLAELNVSIVDGTFDCSYNRFTSVNGLPKEVKQDFICVANGFLFEDLIKPLKEEDIRSRCNVKGRLIMPPSKFKSSTYLEGLFT